MGGEWICLDLGPMERPNVLEKWHRFEIGQGDGRPGEECQMWSSLISKILKFNNNIGIFQSS